MSQPNAESLQRLMDSEVWQAVKADMQATVAGLLERLSTHRIDPIETEYTRGQIAALRAAISLPQALKDELTADADQA